MLGVCDYGQFFVPYLSFSRTVFILFCSLDSEGQMLGAAEFGTRFVVLYEIFYKSPYN